MTQRGKKEQGNSRARKYWPFLVGVVALGVLWLYLDRPVTTEVVNAVVTQGVWKAQRHSNVTYQGTAKIEDGTLVNFTTYQSVSVGTHIKFYRHQRPMSGFTTYVYVGP